VSAYFKCMARRSDRDFQEPAPDKAAERDPSGFLCRQGVPNCPRHLHECAPPRVEVNPQLFSGEPQAHMSEQAENSAEARIISDSPDWTKAPTAARNSWAGRSRGGTLRMAMPSIAVEQELRRACAGTSKLPPIPEGPVSRDGEGPMASRWEGTPPHHLALPMKIAPKILPGPSTRGGGFLRSAPSAQARVQTEFAGKLHASNSLELTGDVHGGRPTNPRDRQKPARLRAVRHFGGPEKARGRSPYVRTGLPAPRIARGVHQLWFLRRRYVHLAARRGVSSRPIRRTTIFYLHLRFAQLRQGPGVGRWWLPGTRGGRQRAAPTRNPGPPLLRTSGFPRPTTTNVLI